MPEGLAQLHQLRGRVGRGARKSTCLLLFYEPLSALAKQRLRIIRANDDGFAIAREDLRLRGPGEFLGAGTAVGQVVDDAGEQGEVERLVAGGDRLGGAGRVVHAGRDGGLAGLGEHRH